MCGRFVGFRNLEELKKHFNIDRAACEAMESYNIAPSQEVLAVLRRGEKTWLDKFHWGLVPFWARDTSIGSRMINARAESAAQKPSFRNAFRKRRCLIPADGFYEWQGKKGDRRPIYITLPEDVPFAFAGLWETWDDNGNAEAAYRSCTILTTAASASIRPIHHRMPVVLKPEVHARWMAPENRDVDGIERILREEILTDFVHRPVSRQVNSVRNNDPGIIQPLTQMELKL